LGGLPTPRAPQEIRGSTGGDVLDNKCGVVNKNGQDVTKEFIKGAEKTLKIARQLNIKEFISKSGSPPCGCHRIHDDSFCGKLIDGDGVTTVLLKRNGIKIISEEDL